MPSRSRNKFVTILNIKEILQGKKILSATAQGTETAQSSRRTTLRKVFWINYNLNLDNFVKPEALFFLTTKMQSSGATVVLKAALAKKNKLPELLSREERIDRETKLNQDLYHYKKFRDLNKRQMDGRQYLV